MPDNLGRHSFSIAAMLPILLCFLQEIFMPFLLFVVFGINVLSAVFIDLSAVA